MSDTTTVGPGTVLAGRYELTAEIGRGGFGRVYQARQLNMDRDVAVKVLPPEFMTIHDVVERFKREAKLASRLRHPNTITLHDYGQHENSLFIVMELLTGEDVADLLKREGRLAPERILRIARQVLKSLHEAHEHGIVHRDLKPENIFLSIVGDERDHVKVLDFGIAKMALPGVEQPGDGRRLTLSGSTVGTPAYMSPEQAAGEEVDGQTDLYALGVIMYEMASGRPPFNDREAVKVMRAHLFEPIPRFRDPNLHDTVLERVIFKALQKEKSSRFKSAQEFLLALAGEPVARPIVKGLDLASLSEPSTTEFDPGLRDEHDSSSFEDGPTTDRSVHESIADTLAFADAVSSPDADSDAVPFSALSTDPPPARDKATVRSGVTSGSGLEARAGDVTSPPRGFERPDDTAGSSILTVIQPPEDSEAEVILLTKRKTPEPLDSAMRESPSASAAANAPAEPSSTPAPAPDTPHSRSDARPLSRSFETADKSSEWAWGTGSNGNDAAEPPPPTGSTTARWMVIALLLLLAGAAAFFFREDLVQFLP